MPERLGEAVLELNTRDQKFVRGVNKAERLAKNLDRQFKRVSRSLDRVGRSMQGLGKRLSIAITAPIIAIGVASVRTASDIQELNNLTQVTFGKSTKAVLKWSKEVGKAVGRSSTTLQKAATEFGAFLKPLGIAPAQIAPMSQALSLLVTDISSFRNISEEVALTRLFSGLAGETEAVRRLGIDIGQTAIQQELLNLGITGGALKATQAQKVLARFNLIVKQTRDAQGDAARTSEAFENQVRRLTESLKDARIEIGTLLLPRVTELVVKFREAIQGFLTLTPQTRQAIISFSRWALVIGPVIFGFGGLVRALGFSVIGIKKLIAGIRLLGLALVSFPALLVIAIASIVGLLVVFKDTIINFAKGLITALKKELIEQFETLIIVPFKKKINDLIDLINKSTTLIPNLTVPLPVGGSIKFGALPKIEHLQINDVIPNSFNDDFKAIMEQAKKDASREMDSLKRNVKAALKSVSDLFTSTEKSIPKIQAALPKPQTFGVNADPLAEIVVTAQRLPDLLKKTRTETKNLDNAFARMGATFTSAFENAIFSGEKFSSVLAGLLKDIARLILRAAILDPLSNAISGGIKSLFGREHGGRVQAGKPVVVGEKRAEIFQPDSAGRIIPSIAGGGVNVTLQIDASGADPSVLANMMRLIEARLIPQAIEGARSAVFSDLSRPEFA